MCLNEYGQVVENEWLQTKNIRSNIETDIYAIMPNHFHGIVVLHEDSVGARRCLAQENLMNVGYPDDSNGDDRQLQGNSMKKKKGDPPDRPYGLKRGSIGAIIGQFKSLVTKQINQMRNTPGTLVWQRNYYEHIIRNEKDLYAIREYIQNNPLKWDLDENNPVNVKHNAMVSKL
jgi:REP element-mobilizing transposase RayT